MWKQHIDCVIEEKIELLLSGSGILKKDDVPIVPPGAIVHHAAFGEGQVVGIVAEFPEYQTSTMEFPYLISLPEEVSTDIDGKTLYHERFGAGTIKEFMIVFSNKIIKLTYPMSFEKSVVLIE